MRKYSLFLLLLLCQLLCSGQPNNYHFHFINLPESFRNQYITLMDEDAAGMLWFITNNGLHRYDGNQVLTFDMQSHPALPDINILYLFADSHKNLWIATRNDLVRFDLQTWTTQIIHLSGEQFLTTRDREISAIAEDTDGTIYIGTGNGKLFRFASGGLQLITQLRLPGFASSGNYPVVTTIQAFDQHYLWLTTDKGQVVQVNKRNSISARYYEPAALKEASIRFFTRSNAGKYMLYAEGFGAYLLDTATGTATQLITPPGLPLLHTGINYPIADQDDKVALLFAGYGANEKGFGLYDFKTNSFENLNAIYPSSLKNSIFRKTKYRNKKIYVSTDRGIAVISYTKNPFYTSQSDLQNANSIRMIYKTKSGQLYIGSYKEKFVLTNEITNEKRQLSDIMVSCIIPWKKDTFLVGTEGDFPQWYYPSSNQLIPVFKEAISAQLNSQVLRLCKENDSLVWAGTYAGCYLFNPEKGTLIKTALTDENSPIQKMNVSDILKRGSTLYFATWEGIFKYNTAANSISRLFIKTDSNYATARFNCMQLIDGNIWAGTSGKGILVFDTSGRILKKITTTEGLASNIVFSLPKSGEYVTAGTSNGISIININSDSIRSFSSSYYLPANEFNRSAWFVQNDTVYMGTVNGIIRFNVPQLLHTKQSKPQIRFSGFSISDGNNTINDYTVAYRNNPVITIPAGTQYFSLGFSGSDAAAAELDLYYRLGENSTWQQIGQQRAITFVNIAPGNYTIQIAARLADGQWTENLLTIPLKVQPTFYQTWWFKIILIAAGAGLVWLGMKYREQNLRKEEQLRSRIASDLHDEVGSALTRIYFQAGLLSADTEALPAAQTNNLALQKIAASSQEALSSMSDMVWSIDARFDNAVDMVGRIKDYVARLHDEMECSCTFEVSGNYKNKPLSQVVRQNILLIFKEVVTNAIKHGDGKNIHATAVFEENDFSLTVENGLPLQKENLNKVQGGHGLQSMQLRAGKIKATLNIDKTQTKFSVRLRAKL